MSVPRLYYKITQTRSAIALPQHYKSILNYLGLKRKGRVVYRRVSPMIAGSIAAVKELVQVELSEKKLTKAEIRDAKRPKLGFVIEKD
ncbi:mitochondrial 54S ribosomal protein uL30m ASCRUDRAFT_93772 [Ascoidea rubescens DSM 1968]|uniref:Large ribosomal subunit protein uL30m n=1 Tax=Ascoidea rubescens DSM 1968 TaxID=1344418 RepID=A0A1D2VNU0_9ASCO|nr:hypothetical protein ASCRUDRAFT_93772 [Ascoidea rubescens DSM 1968]ODV63259.1 hypothetical protein ASCRUDRAFT_93772 [Ascoidea rubescens DSM 1968]